MNEWLTSSQIADMRLPGLEMAARNIRAKAKRERWASREQTCRGGTRQEYHITSLPPEARAALASKVALAAIAQAASTSCSAPVPDAKSEAAVLPAGALATLTTSPIAARQRQANAVSAALANIGSVSNSEAEISKQRIILLFQRYWDALGGQLHPALEAFSDHWSKSLIDCDAALRAQYPRLSASTLRGWYLRIQKRGHLKRNSHPRKNQFAALSGDIGTAVLAMLHEKPHLSAASIHEVLSQLKTPNLPSLRAFQRAITAFKSQNAQGWSFHVNPDGWRSQFMSASGDASAHVSRPNEEWQLDSTVADVELFDAETGEFRRHAIIACIDVFTRRVRFLVTRTSRANAIMAVIRLCINDWGLPERVKTDNGQDYVAEALEFALRSLDIAHRLCEPFEPQQKPFVERVFGTLTRGLFPLLDGFVGHSVAQRTELRNAESFEARLCRKEGLGKTVALRLSPAQLQTMINTWVGDYEAARHGTLEMSPAAKAEAHTTQVVRVDERALDILLAPLAKRAAPIVQKKGIRVDNGWYTAAELGGLEGEQVIARQDDSDIGVVYVFNTSGHFVCKALDTTRLGVSLAEVSKVRKAHQAKAVKAVKAQLKQAARDFDVNKAVRQVYLERTDAAVDASQAGNVRRMKPRDVSHSSEAIASVTAALDTPAPQLSESARAAMARIESAPAAPVLDALKTPNEKYSAWVRIDARVSRGEALSAKERAWYDSYSTSAEWRSMNRLHAGHDPLAVEAGG